MGLYLWEGKTHLRGNKADSYVMKSEPSMEGFNSLSRREQDHIHLVYVHRNILHNVLSTWVKEASNIINVWLE